MPQESQEHRQDRQQNGDGCKKHTDLGGLPGGNHISRKTAKSLLKLLGTRSGIILSSGHIGDLGQCFFINIPTKAAPSASQSTSAKLLAKPSPSAKWIVALTIHGRT